MGVTMINRLTRRRTWLCATTSRIVLLAAAGAFVAPLAHAQSETMETIVVTGVRESMRSALNIKAKSNEIVDAIVAEDIGKLPDPNISETLTRLPGIQGYRYAGEGASPSGSGSGMTIRGLTGQTSTQIDGRDVITAGQNTLNVEATVPGMVAGLEVFKNPTADHIEGGIGGVINIKTRRPFDFNSDMFSASVTGRYNDTMKVVSPDYLAMGVMQWDMGKLGKMGLLLAGNYQESANRSDSNAGGAGTNWRLPVSCAAAGVTCAGTANGAAFNYNGNSSISKLVSVSNPATFDYSPYAGRSQADVVSLAGFPHNVFNENILRTRIGVSGAFQWQLNDKVELYVDGTYNYYLYHQRYEFLQSADSGYVKDLTTTPYNIMGAFVLDRSAATNPAADAVLSSKRFGNGTFVDSTWTSTGGNEDHPYSTMVVSGGANWSATNDLSTKFDVSYTKASVTVDNRSVALSPKLGQTWDTFRDATKAPALVGIANGASSSTNYLPGDARAWVFNNYGNGTWAYNDDQSYAATIDVDYALHGLPLTAIRAGIRYYYLSDLYNNRSFSGKNLTTDGAALAANQANAISVANSAYQGQTIQSPSNIFGGELGYGGGYVIYNPEMLRKDRVRSLFPNAGIPLEDGKALNLNNWSDNAERTFAGYVMGEFDIMNGFITGNAGVRVVQSNVSSTTYVLNDPIAGASAGYHLVTSKQSRVDPLPSANVIVHWTDELVSRFGYAHQITRPALPSLAPTVNPSVSDDSVSLGSPDLQPYSANSFDLSLEYYFTSNALVSVGLWDKEISGFPIGLASCRSLSDIPAVPAIDISHATYCHDVNQRYVSQSVNGGDGYARGVEVQGQMFFDFLPGIWSNFGAQASYTYVETALPAAFPVTGQPGKFNYYDIPQPFLSKNAYTLQLLYDDDALSGRLVYTYRSDFVLFGIGAAVPNGRYIRGYGILDGNVSYKIGHGATVRAGISNITNTAPNRYIGEPGMNSSDFERQSYYNGRIYTLGIAFSTGE